MLYSWVFFILVAILAIALAGAVYAWRQRTVAGARSLAGELLCVAFLALCDILAAVGTSEHMARVFEGRLRFIGVSGSTMMVLVFALEYTGRRQWLRPRYLAALSLVPVLTQVLIWFGPAEIFMFDLDYIQRGGFYWPEAREYGAWFLVNGAYGYVLILTGFGLLLNEFLRPASAYRGQAMLLLSALLGVIVISFIRTFAGGVLLRVDWVVMVSFAMTMLWMLALFRYGLRRLAPVAREMLIEQMDDVVIVLDAEHQVADFNPAAQRTFGWAPATAIGQSLAALLPDWPPDLMAQLRSPDDVQAEIRLDERDFDLRASSLCRGRRSVGCLLVLRDVSAGKQTMIALRQSEAQTRAFQQKLVVLHQVTMELAQIEDLPTLYRRAIELARDRLDFERIGLFMIDEGDPTMMVGAFGLDVQGHIRDERAARNSIAENNLIREALGRKAHFEVWENAPLWDEREPVGTGWNAMATLWNGTEGIGWLVADNLITQKPLPPYLPELLALYGATLGSLVTNLRNRSALLEGEARFRRLSEATLEGIVIHDQGTILDVNPAFAAMFGYDRSEIIGTDLLDMVDVPTRGVAEAVAVAGEDSYEASGWRKDGSAFPAEIHARMIPYQGRDLWVAAVRDLTHRKQAEIQAIDLVMEKERVQILADFIANASHEFRTPLSVIEVKTYLIRKTDDPVRHQVHLDEITAQVRSLSALVDDLVAMAGLDTVVELNLVPFDVNALLRMLHARLSTYAEDNDLALELDLQPDAAPVRGDRTRLMQALTEMAENALRYTEPGGTVTLRSLAENGRTVVEIQDTGIGIAPDQQKRIFERFYRADQAHSTRGFGLGLPIARRIVELHHAAIEVESDLGAGSVFRVIFPASEPGED